MLIAGAVCPHPPLLIPEALGSAASDPPDELRKVTAAAAWAVAGLAAARPDAIVVVGGGAADREYGADASGGLHAFGVSVTIGAGEPVLPLSLTVGRWLLEQGGILYRDGAAAGGVDVVFQEVARSAAAGDCIKLGRILADRAPRVALLAMGDACARPAREAPGVPDPDAQDYDWEVRRGARRRGRPLARPAGPSPGRGACGGRPGGVAGAGGRGRGEPHAGAAAVHVRPLRGHLPGRILGALGGLTRCPAP